MSNIHQVLCMIDRQGIIQERFGNENEVYVTSILHVGDSIHSIPWQSVFLQPLDLNSTFQSLTTRDGGKVFFHRYPVKERTSIFEGSIYVFTNITTEKTNFGTTLIYDSPSMKHIMSIIENVSQVDSTVLLLGESGVGKSALAKLIHDKSQRKKGPFLAVNCGALPENLIESELFGYEAGAFTGGSNKGKKGLFEAAENGSILLDEIAELPFFMQSKLLDVVQENKIRKVGGIQEKRINVRVLAATNKNLSELVQKNKFREDLFYRLNVVPINIPPLRKRKEEIPKLVENFLSIFNQKYNRAITVSDEVMEELIHYQWPGNIRELANRMERLVVTNNVSEINKTYYSSSNLNSINTVDEISENSQQTSFPSLKEAKARVEKELILKVYSLYKNTYKTAEALNVDQSTISKKIKQYKNEGTI